MKWQTVVLVQAPGTGTPNPSKSYRITLCPFEIKHATTQTYLEKLHYVYGMKWPRCSSTWDFRSVSIGSRRQYISETANLIYLEMVQIKRTKTKVWLIECSREENRYFTGLLVPHGTYGTPWYPMVLCWATATWCPLDRSQFYQKGKLPWTLCSGCAQRIWWLVAL